ncbi:MAG: hypothetical protein JSW73_03165 [Candidatus Woesearchaeota archaeon]|nr:MAG: hypothetical protein JSW73_03165 [Candidatus Woesearchaeota archaeon]
MDEKEFNVKKFKEKRRVDHRKLVLDLPAAGLEPTYYWLTDYLKNVQGYQLEKTDEAVAVAVASSFFSDLGMKKTRMEQRAKEIMADVNTVIKSILQLVYDLKEFDRRLEIFDDLRKLGGENKDAAEIAIKSVWMDEVDTKRGVGSINQLTASGKLEFVTLRDAFLQAKSVKDVESLDLNERVKRIVGARIEEYEKWRDRYEKDLRQRRKIEKSYLKAQVASLKQYSKWARPYLLAAHRLRQSEELYEEAAIDVVNFFDTSTVSVSIMGRKESKASSYFYGLTRIGKNPMGLKGSQRVREPSDTVYQAIEMVFIFSSKPIIVNQSESGKSYRHMGQIIVDFYAYVFTKSELEKIKEAQDREIFGFIDQMTKESLDAIADDLDEYLNEPDDKEKTPSINILGGFFDIFGAPVKGLKEMFGPLVPRLPKKKEGEKKVSRKDRWLIKLLKEQAREKVLDDIYKLFKIYRKAHGYITFRG